MKLLKDLTDKYHYVWIRCGDEKLQRQFLLHAESEGFIALNGQKPTELECHELYGLNDDMTMGYLSAMVWSLTMKNPADDHVRIDYGRYIEGMDAVIEEKKGG